MLRSRLLTPIPRLQIEIDSNVERYAHAMTINSDAEIAAIRRITHLSRIRMPARLTLSAGLDAMFRYREFLRSDQAKSCTICAQRL
jgi:hypothetical protein